MGDEKPISFVPYIYNIMTEQKVLMSYLGDVSPQITNILLKAIKNDTSGFDANVVVRKKIYKIIVECLENIMRHSEVIEKKDDPSIFLLGRDDSNYYIITGNYVYNEKSAGLKKALEDINGLEKEKIREIYSEVLTKGNISEKGGAGLGIIDIALKSGNKLIYDFIPVENNISFFILKVQVGKT